MDWSGGFGFEPLLVEDRRMGNHPLTSESPTPSTNWREAVFGMLLPYLYYAIPPATRSFPLSNWLFGCGVRKPALCCEAGRS